eukprot:scaffold241_cov242-Pinguiococcus_pyrenoidosus.AAC.13
MDASHDLPQRFWVVPIVAVRPRSSAIPSNVRWCLLVATLEPGQQHQQWEEHGVQARFPLPT